MREKPAGRGTGKISLIRLRQRVASIALAVLAPIVLSSSSCGDDTAPPTDCTPNTQESCYEGEEGTLDVGACRAGLRTCGPHGDSFSACQGQTLPVAEDCATSLDDDCDGEVNEDCACIPTTYERCYSGPDGTNGVGICKWGFHRCDTDGIGFGECEGEVTPTTEDCTTPEDDDCDGEANEADECLCSTGETQPCYTGPDGTADVGVCASGVSTCAEGAFGECVGDVTPDGGEDCGTPFDDDCDGDVNEPDADCTCSAGEMAACYTGPVATLDVGSCHAGTQECEASGDGYGACVGDVVPVPEDCSTPDDDDCDGEVNEEDAGCECTPATSEPCYTGPAFTVGVGTCKKGMRTCNASGQWGTCAGQIIPIDEDCNTPLDENCDGSVNEPNSGCACSDEFILTLESEDCIANYGEPEWQKKTVGLPLELGADDFGNAYLLLRRVEDTIGFEPVPVGMTGAALVGRYLPNGDLYWGKELTGVLPPTTVNPHAYNMNIARNGLMVFTAPAGNSTPSAFGEFDTFTWPLETFRVLYSVDPDGYPIFAVSVPKYGSDTNITIHAVASDNQGGAYYVNGPTNSHLISYDFDGTVRWDRPLNLGLDDMAVTPTDDGGVVVAFTTSSTVDFGTGTLPPIAAPAQDLVVVRFNSAGTALWTVRPRIAESVHSITYDSGVVAVLEKTSLLRFEDVEGHTLSDIVIPQLSVAPTDASFSQIGTDGVIYSRSNVGSLDFDVVTVDPYGAMPTGSFVAMSSSNGLRWIRAPLASNVMVAGANPDVMIGVFQSTGTIDLDGTPESLLETSYFLARMAY